MACTVRRRAGAVQPAGGLSGSGPASGAAVGLRQKAQGGHQSYHRAPALFRPGAPAPPAAIVRTAPSLIVYTRRCTAGGLLVGVKASFRTANNYNFQGQPLSVLNNFTTCSALGALLAAPAADGIPHGAGDGSGPGNRRRSAPRRRKCSRRCDCAGRRPVPHGTECPRQVAHQPCSALAPADRLTIAWANTSQTDGAAVHYTGCVLAYCSRQQYYLSLAASRLRRLRVERATTIDNNSSVCETLL